MKKKKKRKINSAFLYVNYANTVKIYVYWRKICPFSELKMGQKGMRLEAEVSGHPPGASGKPRRPSWVWSFKPSPGSERRVKGHAN